jgi:metacaspase-1
MATGIALTIGLNSVDPKHYAGWSGELTACEADAEDMAAIAASQQFKVTTFLTGNATRTRVKKKILEAARALKTGDMFMLSYSGHGGQLPDKNNDEPDGQDETWCLFDGELVDDELYTLFGKFAKGVRVLVLSDSCHSGSVVKNFYYQGARTLSAGAPARYRAMPNEVALRTYRTNRAFYDEILNDPKLKEAKAFIKATVLLLSGCQDNQLSNDGDFNGLFTGQLLRVWKSGQFKGDYRKFHKNIVKRMPPDQTPNYFLVGAASPSFEAQKPFSL